MAFSAVNDIGEESLLKWFVLFQSFIKLGKCKFTWLPKICKLLDPRKYYSSAIQVILWGVYVDNLQIYSKPSVHESGSPLADF